MGRPSGFVHSVSGGAAAVLLVLGGTSAQDSCVQVSSPQFAPSCTTLCDAGTPFTFTMEGQTSVTANLVNVALVIDGSGSVNSGDFQLSKDFAKDTVAAFANQNLFINGGTASFVQFSSIVGVGGTFDNQADYDAFVDVEQKLGGGTDIAVGINAGQQLLDAAPAAAANFMVVITDGNGGSVTQAANDARDAGTTLYAVGVGSGVSESTLLAIAGDMANVFDVNDFDQLNSALNAILSATGGSVPCPSTGATITIEFNAGVAGGSLSGPGSAFVGSDPATIVFDVPDLEDTPTDFSAVLDYCGETGGTNIVASVSYSDNEGNAPDMSVLQGAGATVPTCACGPDVICDDPHMQGLRGQKIDWSGIDGGWYSLIKDDDADLHINVRLNAPLPDEFPDRQLITGLSVMANGHSLVIEIKNPYTIDTDGCPEGVSPCLANGGLRAVVDGEEVEHILLPSEGVAVTDSMVVSGSNLPAECRQFGGDKIWARLYEALYGRRMLTESRIGFEDWIQSFPNMAAPEWCTKYITENNLADLQSPHAIFKIETPTVVVRLNAGVNHQDGGEPDWDGRVLPDLDFWQMDVGLDGLDVENPSLSGILGETARPVYDENGLEVMEGFKAFRGAVEDYRVADSLGTLFGLIEHKGGQE